jgi:glycerol-3-phosphate cytidylyltransferase-like family protein
MIVTTAELQPLRGTVTMVDGGFAPLHPGHIEYFRAAAALGAPVLCSVSPDGWVERKHPVLLTQAERAEVIDAIRYVDYTYLADTSTGGVLDRVCPRSYAKGEDWRGRLPAEEIELCERLGIEIVFLDTVLSSSTAILDRYRSLV